MTLKDAIKLLEAEYDKAVKLKGYVNKPIAYALYNTWKIVDEKEKGRSKRRCKTD